MIKNLWLSLLGFERWNHFTHYQDHWPSKDVVNIKKTLFEQKINVQQLFLKTRVTYVRLEESVYMVDFFEELKDTINQLINPGELKQEDVIGQIFNSF